MRQILESFFTFLSRYELDIETLEKREPFTAKIVDESDTGRKDCSNRGCDWLLIVT